MFNSQRTLIAWHGVKKKKECRYSMHGIGTYSVFGWKKFIDESILLDEYAGVFAKTWYCLGDYVKHERIRRKGPVELKANARFRKHYEIVAIKAQKFYDKNGYDYKIDKQLANPLAV